VRRFRHFYGGQPLHLLATVMSFALVAAGFVGWAQPGSDLRGVLLWLLGCLIATELVLLPSAWLLDRIAIGASHGSASSDRIRSEVAYVRTPALLSGLLLIVFAPLIFSFDGATYTAVTATTTSRYLSRWLFSTAALFGISAVTYAIKLARDRRRARL
jgi:hypothetical protein